MSWCPDTAKVKKKMLYSSSFDALKKSLVGVQKYIQVCTVRVLYMYTVKNEFSLVSGKSMVSVKYSEITMSCEI
jgi:hypothetical protein